MTYSKGTIINISGTTPVDDPEYRYKMPVVFGKVEGSGNGIKTKIENISEVALSLHRSPGEVNKFFGCELGAQTTYNEDDDRAIVNGNHTDDTLQKLVHRYIEDFVLCPNCRLVSDCFELDVLCTTIIYIVVEQFNSIRSQQCLPLTLNYSPRLTTESRTA